ncbi:MAG: hemin-degrading factor [Leptospiraceae bacterium]|nr:hemin-degrading factor [Leptospiraceae bacterium]
MVVRNKYSKKELKQLWEETLRKHPKARIRDVANSLGVSELELLSAKSENNLVPLSGNWNEIIKEVENLGYVMALTRNEACVIENKGYYKNCSVNANVGLVLGENIDLRVFYDAWKYGFVVYEETQNKVKRSIQFFDGNGDAIHKIYLTEKSNQDGLENLIQKFHTPVNEIEIQTRIQKFSEENPNPSKEKFLEDWENLQDTHDFYGMLKKHSVPRIQAMKMAEGKFTRKVSNDSSKELLKRAVQSNLEIMAFVGNSGMIQIFTGRVHHFREVEDWWNILDEEFNLHLKSSLIDSTWIVRKPTKDGEVNSVEVYDSNGEMIVQFFGKRKPGTSELQEWRNLVSSL